MVGSGDVGYEALRELWIAQGRGRAVLSGAVWYNAVGLNGNPVFYEIPDKAERTSFGTETETMRGVYPPKTGKGDFYG